MTHRTDGTRTDADDEALLAELFDTFLQGILDGQQPDLDQVHPDRPDLRARIAETWALACAVVGRREPSRPVLGGYEIVRELGHGGMGTVYLARHHVLQRAVAIKVLPHSLAMSPHAKQRFLEEARALARLRHEHVVHVHRIVDHSEMLAFEMEYVDGPSLRSLILALRQTKQPPAIQSLADALGLSVEALGTRTVGEWFVRLGIKLARALAEVHRHGLVHRDVKPSNILLRANGQPVLADFGLARAGDLDVDRTAFAGTPVYAAPERLRHGDADLDARADVYSLGATLYEALSLDPPFGGQTTDQVLRHIENGRLPSLRRRAPHVSRDLDTVIGKAMEPDRRHRYATADEFADDLERLLALQPIRAEPAGPLRRSWKFLRRHQRLALAAAGGAVLVGVATLSLLAHAAHRATASRRALAERHEARSRLLCPENLSASWGPARLGSGQRVLRTASARDAQLAELGHALDHYDAAVAATPADRSLTAERDTVAVVVQLLRREASGANGAVAVGADLAAVAPLTAALAQRAATSDGSDPDLTERIASAAADDRQAAGLFAFLRNDQDTSAACWRDLAGDAGDRSFRDACLALRTLADGDRERALPRLLQAVREFPHASALAFAMAESAIAANDLGLARRWLQAIPATRGGSIARAHRKRLEADILAAQGLYEQARQGYAELCAADSSDPEPLLRVAALALRQGRPGEAEGIHRELLRRWPDLAAPRLQLARIALQRHDLRGYLQQARSVLQQDLAGLPRRSAAQLAEVLLLGGLDVLHGELCREVDQIPGALREDEAVPLTAWLPARRVAGLGEALRLLRVFDGHRHREQRGDARPIAAWLRAAWHTLGDVPRLGALTGTTVHAALRFGLPLLLEPMARWLEPRLLPYQQALGNRLVGIEVQILFATEAVDRSVLYGHQALNVGDVDGDTLAELCLTAPPFGTSPGGYLELRRLGDGALLRRWSGDSRDGLFARAVAPLGDVDGDLCVDLAIGTPTVRALTGARSTVSLRSGRTGQELWSLEDDTPSFGAALANLGDVDGDGASDLAVGAPPPRATALDRGRVVVYSGRNARPLYEVTAERGGSWFGAMIANAGDTNSDGTDDLVVGGNFGHTAGLVCLYDGRTGSLLSAFREASPTEDFGRLVAGIGDADRDGHADIAISAPGSSSAGNEPGQVHVLSGRSGHALYHLRGDRAGDGFGSAICVLPWYRHPGEPAIAVLARRGGPLGNGYLRVFATATGKPLQTSAGGGAAPFAHAMVDLGDRDGDGFRDLGLVSRTPQRDLLRIVHFGQTPLDQRGR